MVKQFYRLAKVNTCGDKYNFIWFLMRRGNGYLAGRSEKTFL
jgi:hypothetical protein